MKPYIILDIDQDFFFEPILSSTIIDGFPTTTPQPQYQSQGIGSVWGKFIPYINSNTEIKHFHHHDEVGLHIKENNLKGVILYHLDAHHDMDFTATPNTPLTISNWVSCTKSSYTQVYWVLGDKAALGTELLTSVDPPAETHSLFSVPDPLGFIDLITWTDSPGWCPQDRNLFSIFKSLL